MKTLVAITSALLCLGSLARSQETRPTLPSPVRLMYGYKDFEDFNTKTTKGFWPDPAQWEMRWNEVFQHFNVITGSTKNTALVKRLRAEGKIFAYHCSNRRDAKHKTTEDFAAEWSKPFEENLGGQLPGGFDAIALDELHGDLDGSVDSEITIKALREVRRKFPNKLIFVWAPSVVGLAGSPGANGKRYAKGKLCDNQFQMVSDCCDMIILECYHRESSKHLDWFAEIAQNLKARAPALLPKAVFALCISMRDDLKMDDLPGVDFGKFIEKQLKLLRTEPKLQPTLGVAFYGFTRARPEFIPTVNRLVDQYYPSSK